MRYIPLNQDSNSLLNVPANAAGFLLKDNEEFYFGTDRDTYLSFSGSSLQCTGSLQVWNEAMGANDYISIYHTTTDAYISTPTGGIYLSSGNSIINTNAHIFPTGINNRDIGRPANEFRALYLGSGASSGAYFGLNQEARMFYSGSGHLDLVCPVGSGLSIWNSEQASNDCVTVYHNATDGGIKSHSGTMNLVSFGASLTWDGTELYSSTNTKNLGHQNNEWRSLFIGSIWYGVNQEVQTDVDDSAQALVMRTGSGLVFPSHNATPANAVAGQVYYHSGSNQLFGFNGTVWNALF